MSEWKPEPGIYPNVTWEKYKSIPYPSQSMLKHGLRSMKRMKRAMNGELGLSRETVAIGQAVHCMVAGEVDRLAVMPKFELMPENVTATGKPSKQKTTTFYKESKAVWEKENQDKDIIKDREMETARHVVHLLTKNRSAVKLIDSSQLEVTVIGTIEGVLCKTRMDGLNIEEKSGWDLKTTDNIEPQVFYRMAKRLGYFFQFGMQKLLLESVGMSLQKYEIIAAEVDGDFDNGVLLVPFQLIDDWSEKVVSVVQQYRVAQADDQWPGLYPAEIGVVDVPEYDMTENGVFQG